MPPGTAPFGGGGTGHAPVMMSTLMRGALAGAAGATALNTATYADMALRGRPSSSAPQQLVDTLADKTGVGVPGEGETRDNRVAGLGPLAGLAVSTGVALALAAAWRGGVRLPWWAGAPLAGALAMTASDVPMAALGISDPRTWSAADWASDAVPHLAYGLAAYGSLAAVERRA